MKHKEKIFKLLKDCAETPQEILAVDEMISKVENKILPIETVNDTKKIFNDFNFYKNKKGRYTCTITLHRFIWQFYNGKIPDGYDIHHSDFNKENNDISNLELITKEEHKKIHSLHKIPKTSEKKIKFICKVCGKDYESVNRGNNNYCSPKCKKIAEKIRTAETKICEICGKEFSTSDNARFCSKKCVGKFLNRHEEKVCPVCGKIFSDVVSKHRKHCSPECAAKALMKRESRICLNCGKDFSAHSNGSQKFCSEDCFYKFRQKREEKICPTCGKKFLTQPSKNKKYCSRSCYFKSKKLHDKII